MTSSDETSEVGAAIVVDALRSSDMIESVEDGVASDGTGSTTSSTAIGGGGGTTVTTTGATTTAGTVDVAGIVTS